MQIDAPLYIKAVALTVRDLDQLERFYRDIVGLEVVARSEGASHLDVGGTTFLDLLHRPGVLPGDPESAGLYHAAFLLPSRANLGRWLVHAEALRLQIDGAADHLVSEAVYLHDPEGNGIEVNVDRPRSEWQWMQGTEGAPGPDGE